MKNYFAELSQGEIAYIIIGSLLISFILLILPKKIISYLNIIIAFCFAVFCLITINNTAISMAETTPFLIALSFYLFFYFITDTFKISIKKQEKVVIVKE